MNFTDLSNLALGKTAQQSSISKKSQPDDGTQDFIFHTDIEDNPWWQIDLGAVYPLHYIVIGNRQKMCQERAITLTVEISLDGKAWRLIHTGLISWDDDLVWPLGGLVSARFVRLSLREKRTCLHFAKVEVWGIREGGLKRKLEKNVSPLWAETKPEGLEELHTTVVTPAGPTEMILDLGDFQPIWALELAAPPKTSFKGFKDLKIEHSIDGRDWRIVHEGLLFWTGRLYYPLQGEIMARFIKISRPEVCKKYSGLWHTFHSLLHCLLHRCDLPIGWPLIKVFTRRQPDLQVWAMRHDGLGARLMALLHAMYLAKLLNCDYKFVWPELNHAMETANSMLCLEDAQKVFDADFLQAHLLANGRPSIASKLRGSGNYSLSRRQLTGAAKQTKPGIIYSGLSAPDILYHPRLGPFAPCFKSLFESLPFSPAYQEIVEMARRVELPPNYVALHLRSGDLIFSDIRKELLRWIEKAAPVQLAKLILEKFGNENRPIVIFSRDSDLSIYLAERYKVFLATDYLPSKALPLDQRDLFEIILMSRASHIYTCSGSLYSRCASWIGGNVKQTDLHGQASSEEKTAYIKADLERNADCYHPFHNSFSYLYIYHLNHLTANQEESAFYLSQAHAYDPENEMINMLQAAEYFKYQNYKAGEDLLETWLKLVFDLDRQTIQYESNRFLDRVQAPYFLPYYMQNYLQPLEAAAQQGHPNAAAVLFIMYDLLPNEERAMFWRKAALNFKTALMTKNYVKQP